MYHTAYLAGLCSRRQWPEPFYQITATRNGYTCIVRVNNREYQTAKFHPSENSAKEDTALIAFTICRSFSVNDGMCPNGFAHHNIVQGRPVPVGAPSRQTIGTVKDGDDVAKRYSRESFSTGSRSGGSSPDLTDELKVRQHAFMPPQPASYAYLRKESYHRRRLDRD